MKNPSSISRRIESCIHYTNIKNYESAMINFFPALDKTAKKRRQREGVGSRIKKFISDEEEIITAISMGNILKNVNCNGVSFPEAIYKFGRTSIAHEGELDKRLNFNDVGELSIGNVWNLPSSYINGLLLSVILAPENKNEYIKNPIEIILFRQKFKLNELWGAKDDIKKIISNSFRNPELFK